MTLFIYSYAKSRGSKFSFFYILRVALAGALLLFHSLSWGFDSLRSLLLVSFPDGLHGVPVVVLHQNAPLPAPRRQPDGLVTRVLRRQILLRVRERANDETRCESECFKRVGGLLERARARYVLVFFFFFFFPPKFQNNSKKKRESSRAPKKIRKARG